MMTTERIAELRGVRNEALDEALDEIERLNALIATRPATHVLRLDDDTWHCEHPIDCKPLDCQVVNADIALDLLDDLGPGTYVHDPISGAFR